MRKNFLIDMGFTLEVIEKKCYFKAHEDANKAYVEQRKLVKQTKAALAKPDGTTSKGTGSSIRKSSKKPKETAATASQPDPVLQAEYVSAIEEAKEAAEKAKAKIELAAVDMFQLYANLLSINAKYTLNKVIHKQTQSDPYTDLQGCSRKGPSCKSLHDCMTYHLLTVFPNNAAEQIRYYITNVLKKPQHISMQQFVQCVEQLNSYIM
jgi:hypothetical protein